MSEYAGALPSGAISCGEGFKRLSALARHLARLARASVFAIPAFFGAADDAFAEDRALKLYFTHTGERATITFKRDGKYDQRGLAQINRFLRDWRKNEPTKMDPDLLDTVWEVYQRAGGREPIHVVSAYRSPSTNNMLRTRNAHTGVAKKSQHMLGKAMDFYIPGVRLAKLRAIAMQMQGGGVGYYPTSGSPFVHVDVGRVRAWPRMSRQELASIFPSGKTLHMPADGRPLPGYGQAVADYKRRGAVRSVDIATDDDDDATPGAATPVAPKATRESPSPLMAALLPVPRPRAQEIFALQAAALPAPAESGQPSSLAVAALSVPLPTFRPPGSEALVVDPIQTASIGPVAALTALPQSRPSASLAAPQALQPLGPAPSPEAARAGIKDLPMAETQALDAGVAEISDEALMAWAFHSSGRPHGLSAPRPASRTILTDWTRTAVQIDDEDEEDEDGFEGDRFGLGRRG